MTAISIILIVIALFALQITANAQGEWTTIPGHVTPAVMSAEAVSHTADQTTVPLAVALPLRNPDILTRVLDELYNPKDAQYHHFLSTSDFVQEYAPTAADYQSVIDYLRSMGLTVTGTSPNRLIVDAVGSAASVERAFGVNLYNYRAADGSMFYATDSDPQVATSMVSKISAIVGLDNAAHWSTHMKALAPSIAEAIQPWQVGTGPGGALDPKDIATAYGYKGLTLSGSSTPVNGAGQTAAVFELDGYHASDIASYCNYYAIRQVPLQNVLIDGYSGAAGPNSGEVTLDIELINAVAPGASKILVYEAPNSGQGVIDEFNRIASDNVAKQISTSWGLPETELSGGALNAENSIFKQMAAQGQSMFAATGDSGAYDNKISLSVDDPGSQPYVTGVGGTQLFVNTNGTYRTESTWNDGNIEAGAGGGGVSAIWRKPSWQGTVGISSAMRNVPDVSFNADPYTGYSVFYNNTWYIFGGTSCAAPCWTGFTALVNQQRAAKGSTTLGFANAAIYPIAESSRYDADFHDVADDSTNLFYPAIKGYDNATGWGSFNGANLLSDLSGIPAQAPPLTITGGPSVRPSTTSAVISWNTNASASSTVFFGMSAGTLSRSVTSTTQTTSHQMTVPGLLHGRTYFYTVTSADAGGSVSSTVGYFKTN